MKAKILMLILIAGIVMPAAAQLSKRENNPSVIKTGTRPETGDFGLFIGPSIAEIGEMADNDIEFRGLPLVNVKLFLSNKTESRLGIQYYKTRTKIDGTLAENEIGTTIDSKTESFFRITPGVAHHFSPKNILDAYMGVGIPLGTESYKVETNWMDEATGDFQDHAITKSSFVYGYNLFIGLQAYVADLPFAFGLEYGIYGIMHTGLKYKHELTQEIGGVSDNQTYYTTDETGFGTNYSELKYKKFEGGSDLRLTLSYFFGK
jgi:hypothetical protein